MNRLELPSPADAELISRRDALGALSALGAAAAAIAAAAPALAQGQQPAAPLTPNPEPRPSAPGKSAAMAPGWDPAKGEYVLPPLPYDAKSLEPHIDGETMTIHHDKHHAAYVKGANRALAELAKLRSGEGDATLIKHWARELSFHASGHVNHMLFWSTMLAPDKGGGGKPSGALAEKIDKDFGSFDAFSTQFQGAANSVEGSGWGWLVHEPLSDKLFILQGEKQQDLTIWGVHPLLGVDVWEHAYYLKYRNNRADYVKAFMNVINWKMVEALHARK